MKKIHRVFAMLMAAIMALSLVTTAFAEPTIDPAKKASRSEEHTSELQSH